MAQKAVEKLGYEKRGEIFWFFQGGEFALFEFILLVL